MHEFAYVRILIESKKGGGMASNGIKSGICVHIMPRSNQIKIKFKMPSPLPHHTINRVGKPLLCQDVYGSPYDSACLDALVHMSAVP